MNRRSFIKSLCATWFSLSFIKDYHLDWLGDRHTKEETNDAIMPLPEYAERMGISLISLDGIGGYSEFTDWNEMIDWHTKTVALAFSVDPQFLT